MIKVNSETGNLEITVDAETQKFLQSERAELLDFESDGYMYECLESMICNCEYEWIRPDEIGTLTDAPILGLYNEAEDVTAAWGFMDYQVRSVQDDLADYGKAIFVKG